MMETNHFRSELNKLEYLQNSLEILNAAIHSQSTLPPHVVPMEIDRITEELAAICQALRSVGDGKNICS